MERALDGSLDLPHTHVASLDFTNASNSLAGRDVADALGKYAKVPYRAAVGRVAPSRISFSAFGSPRPVASAKVIPSAPSLRAV